MSDVNKPISRPDPAAARDAIRVNGTPPVGGAPLDAPDGTVWDKPAPDGPPQPKELVIPPHLTKLAKFFRNVIADESLVLEMCLDRCIDMVKVAISNRTAGIEVWDPTNPFHAVNYAQIAGPLTVELYKETLKAIEGRKDEFETILGEAKRELERSKPGPKIHIATGP